MRVNLSFAIVAMVFSNASSAHLANASDACPNLHHPHAIQQQYAGISLLAPAPGEPLIVDPFEPAESEGEFDWDGEDQGIILGAFFWGYVVTQVPGGMLAERIGGKWPFGIGMLITALFSLLTPWAARTGKGMLIVVRVIQGLGEVSISVTHFLKH